MPVYDFSDHAAHRRAYRGTQLYMKSHPAVRACFRGRERPSDFGTKVWETTFRLIDFLDGETPASVLEIGCGWGLLGIHLARRSGARVTCTDFDPRLEPIVRAHAALNGVEVAFKAAAVHALVAADLASELIVGVEICYGEQLRADLCALADRAAQTGTGRLLIADPGRPDFEDLHAYCKAHYPTEILDLRRPGEANPCHLLSVRFRAPR